MRQEPFSADPPRKRNSVKGLIVENDRILLTRNRDHMGDFHLLPGGGQRFGETLHQALVREVLEETGWVVRPGGLVLVRDYVGANHEFADEDGDVHQVELVFQADPIEELEDWDSAPDAWQVGTDWIDMAQLGSLRMYPSALTRLLPPLVRGDYDGPLYLGDVN